MVVPVTVIERRGPIAAVLRSWDLTKGHRTRICLLSLVVYALACLPFLLGSYVAMLVSDAPSADEGHWVVEVLATALFVSLWATLKAVTYYEVRTRAEDVDLDRLSRVSR